MINSTERFNFKAAVYLIIKKGNKIFLLRRFNTGFMDGFYTLIAGHIDGNESIFDTAIREAKEEAGIRIKVENLEVVHVMHYFSNHEYINFFINVKSYSGVPYNVENDKADDAGWFKISNLPKNTIPFIKKVLTYDKKLIFSEEKM